MNFLQNSVTTQLVAQQITGVQGDGTAQFIRFFSHASYSAGTPTVNTGALYIGHSATCLPIVLPTGVAIQSNYIDITVPPNAKPVKLTDFYFKGNIGDGLTCIYY